jgi:hypothetical protein
MYLINGTQIGEASSIFEFRLQNKHYFDDDDHDEDELR